MIQQHRRKQGFAQIFRQFVMGLLISFVCNYIYAVSESKSEDNLPTDSANATWTFSGIAVNESGEQYGYYFQVKRNNSDFHAVAALIETQTQHVVLFDENSESISEPKKGNWKIGRAFLRFNPINNSWIFGVKDKNKKGFNFKIDMLKQAENKMMVQALRPGIELLISPTGRLNGHIRVGDSANEQFVTAKASWFRQIWLTKYQEKLHPLSGVLCHFQDDSGFYSVNMRESDALRGAVAGWRDSQGMPATMSQFINIKQAENNLWQIGIASPKLHLVFHNILNELIAKDNVVAGFIDKGKKKGFCALNENIVLT